VWREKLAWAVGAVYVFLHCGTATRKFPSLSRNRLSVSYGQQFPIWAKQVITPVINSYEPSKGILEEALSVLV
jgi:hypothetical protein